MKRIYSIAMLITLSAWCPFSVYSQTCCTGGAPITGGFQIGAEKKGNISFGAIFDLNRINALILEGQTLDDDRILRNTNSFIFQGNYGVSDKLTFTMLIPYVWLNETISGSISETKSETSGIGDLTLLSQYQVLSKSRSILTLGLGVKFPTGGSQLKGQNNFVLPITLQPGSGSFDFILAGQFSTSLFESRQSLSFYNSLTYRLNTESDKVTFHDTYQFGNELLVLSGFSDQVLLGSTILEPSLMLRFRHTGQDTADEHLNPNTGGNWLYLVPGARVKLSSQISSGITADLPIYRNLKGFQLTTSYRITFSLFVNLAKKTLSFDIDNSQ
ncbi:hypothetical protein QQ008_01840 [Fulvivirgaceae bacterium BMA10]|uniref:Transporter n=1 Tax=Splendidivirga corallicola TaxID=3051826 RepID=A0ABT8KK06_9BACT|nr:hypothetical protein [Fulvivirgaceae bacterium BMA10]